MNSAKRIPLIGSFFLLAMMLTASAASAHNWGCWKQPDRTVKTYNTAGLRSQAAAAVSEWDSKTILNLPAQTSHTDISVFDGYYGNTGWAGLASIESYSGCTILHGHARVNRSYSYSSNGYRGIFCQEVGHLFGLDHSNDGGCMGGGYYYDINTNYSVVQHNISDIGTKYASTPALVAGSDLAGFETARSGEGGFLERALRSGGTRAVAFWNERPRTIEDAMKASQAVVAARVLNIRAGDDLVVPVEGLEDGVDRIPTQRILFSVERVLAGTMRSRVFELAQTGNDDFVIEESPAYRAGERYVLFLTSADGGAFRAIAPEGRLRVTATGLEPTSEREFMSELRGSDIEPLAAAVGRIEGSSRESAEISGVQFRRTSGGLAGSGLGVSYALPGQSDVKLQVFDTQGRVVRTLVSGSQDAQRWYSVEWDGADDRGQRTPNGVYFFRLQTRYGSQSLRVTRLN